MSDFLEEFSEDSSDEIQTFGWISVRRLLQDVEILPVFFGGHVCTFSLPFGAGPYVPDYMFH